VEFGMGIAFAWTVMDFFFCRVLSGVLFFNCLSTQQHECMAGVSGRYQIGLFNFFSSDLAA
jgi:hypothetical protein